MNITLVKKVFLHDTDSTGTVYYSRYLEWFEEARMEMLEVNYKALNNLDVSFVPSKVSVEYKSPARLSDILIVKVNVKSFTKCSIVLDYEVKLFDNIICSSEILMVCVNRVGRPTRIPKDLEEILNERYN